MPRKCRDDKDSKHHPKCRLRLNYYSLLNPPKSQFKSIFTVSFLGVDRVLVYNMLPLETIKLLEKFIHYFKFPESFPDQEC